ncbi:hypothetical protein G6F32_015894 [Rhizopus arrhizus]|nr:hypothetical protein G6F32_015894 [Rhizopus arrhizus]
MHRSARPRRPRRRTIPAARAPALRAVSTKPSAAPCKAANAAAWPSELGPEDTCDCTASRARIKAAGPVPQPIRHPVMA